MTILLWILYPIAIQYERGGLWRAVLPITCFALLVDVIANHTELALLTLDFPRRGEWTFSQRLVRLRFNAFWRGDLAQYLCRVLDAVAPSGKHIV